MGLRGDGGSVRRMVTCPASWGDDGRSRAGCADPAGGDSWHRRSRPHGGLCAPGMAHGRTPLERAARADAGEERSRAQAPGQRRPVAEGSAGTTPGNSGCGPLHAAPVPGETVAGVLYRSRSETAAYAPGRRTTGTGVLDRRRPPRTCRRRLKTGSDSNNVTVTCARPGEGTFRSQLKMMLSKMFGFLVAGTTKKPNIYSQWSCSGGLACHVSVVTITRCATEPIFKRC
jgi:hypothetical protein